MFKYCLLSTTRSRGYLKCGYTDRSMLIKGFKAKSHRGFTRKELYSMGKFKGFVLISY